MDMETMVLAAGSGEPPADIANLCSDDAQAMAEDAQAILGLPPAPKPVTWAALVPGERRVPEADALAVEVYALNDATVLLSLVPYTAPPLRWWYPASVSELEERLAEVREAEARTEWAAHARAVDEVALERALELARAGRTVYMSEDDDGPYVAVEL